MDALEAFAIGWDLDHPGIAYTSFAEAPKLGRADVVFLGVSAMNEKLFADHPMTPWRRPLVTEADGNVMYQ